MRLEQVVLGESPVDPEIPTPRKSTLLTASSPVEGITTGPLRYSWIALAGDSMDQSTTVLNVTLSFASVRAAFDNHGGLVRGDDVAERMLRKNAPGLGSLARRIVAGELVCFEYQGERWLPMAQFDPVDMSFRPSFARVAAEMAGVFDGWELCCWLATPNSALRDRCPLELLAQDEDAVLRTARLDRFVACG